ncbi:hypothetical protein BDW59DRAFT_102069 [Aspergillus cavernicola]|uniref:DUF7587 domain-containing protein n=1 Tax=Aspergillus cavernicola TaxID=176166 RepID=A0ABR4I4V4_9EURO
MSLIALNLLEKTPRIRWTSEMRISLCCIVKYYRRDTRTFQALFNAMFIPELNKCGFINGREVEWSTLHSQCEDMKKKGSHIWGDVNLSSFNDTEPWQPYITRIEDTATSFNLRVIRKTEGNIDTSRFTYRDTPLNQLSRSDPPHDDHEPIQELSANSTCHYDTPEAPKQPAETSLCIAGGKVCLWCHLEGLDQQKAASGSNTAETPSLLYRWWNAGSQGVNSKSMFVAGLFAAASSAYFSHDTIPQDKFERHLLSHIGIEHTPSPFISMFSSLLAPIHRGLREKEGASVSIIDSRKLKSDVFSAQAFVEKHGVKIGTYKGFGEHLIWGDCVKDAIICSFKITTLLRIAEEHPDIHKFLQLDTIAAFKRNRRPLHWEMAKNAVQLDKKAGATVGRLLSILEVPQEHCKAVSEGMAYSWRVKTRRIPWGEFFQGVELGYSGQHVMLLPALSPTVNAADSNTIESDFDALSDDDLCFDDSEVDEITDDEETKQSQLDEIEIETNSNYSFAVDALPDTPGPFPIMDSDTASDTPPVDFQDLTIASIHSFDEEMDEAEELGFFDETILYQPQVTSDLFANDRERVRSALN